MAVTMLQSTSRESLTEAERSLDRLVESRTADELSALGHELYAVLRILDDERSLLRYVGDVTVPAESRTAFARQLFGQKLGARTQEVLESLVAARWSRPSDLLVALEAMARRALLGVAELRGELDEVEDEFFRFGRILDREPRLNSLLTDTGADPEKRVELLHGLLDGKVRQATAMLLTEAVRSPRGRALDLAATDLAELAAARRERYVAHVRTAVALTQAQEERLAETLTRMYERQMSLQVELEPDLVGGLVIEVGGELIDGSVSGRMAAAQRQLPS